MVVVIKKKQRRINAISAVELELISGVFLAMAYNYLRVAPTTHPTISETIAAPNVR